MNDALINLLPRVNPLIMLIDEQADRLQEMARILGPEGYRISVAVSGFEARSRAQLIKPDLVIMDEEILVNGRMEAEGRIYIAESVADIPVILMIGRDSALSFEQSCALGAADCICKPVIPAELKSKTSLHILLQRSLQSERSLKEELQVARELIDLMSVTDSLTGLFNHRGFITLAEQQLKLCRRQGKPALLAYMDINGLQRVNEKYGHLVGDQLLIDASTIIRRTFRDSDIIARMGGDEFAAFLVDSDEQKTGILLGRLHSHIEQFNLEKGREYQVSLAVGILPCNPEASPLMEELLSRAAREMMKDKEIGA